jgi:type VI secretion system protein ImpM
VTPGAPNAPGWYGKLPSLGDFASRRLDADWIAHWDHWLAEGLGALRQASPEGWLQNYLASPAWRFALLPGALPSPLGDALRVGVLVPSVDCVGRYFPLTVISPPLPQPATLAQASALWQWTAMLDDIAVDALQDDWTAEQLDQALLTQGAAPPPATAWAPAPGLDALCSQAAWAGLQGCSLWLGPGVQAQPLQVPGLPSGPSFAWLFTAATQAA